jgi:tRNA 2-selenouridine synthase SelU
MRIVGFAPDQKVYKRLLEKTQTCDYIKIEGGDKLVPHNQILKEIANADFCLLPYQKNKALKVGFLPNYLNVWPWKTSNHHSK